MADDTQTAQPDAPPQDDLRASLSAAFDQIDTPAEPQKPEPSPSAAESGTQPRDERGKFAPKSDAAPARAASEPPEGGDQSAAPVSAEPARPEADTEIAKATARWSPADREMLGKIPPEAREFVIRRHREMEADHTRKTTEIAAFRREWEPVEQLLAPHAEQIRASGFTCASLIQGWANAEQTLMRGDDNAAQFLATVAKNYRINPSAVARYLGVQGGASQNPADPPAPQPDGSAPEAQLPPEVLQRLDAQEQWIRQQDRISRQREQEAFNGAATRVMSEIDTFKSEMDSSGAAKHPHFGEVEGMMAHLANVARASGQPVPPLSELYDQAVRANPSTYARLLESERAAWEAQRAAADKKRQDEARAKAERATRAGSSITGAPGPGQSGRASTGSLRDELEAEFDRVSAAA